MICRGEKKIRSMKGYEKIDKIVPDLVLLMARDSWGRENHAACPFSPPRGRI
jgi:hypothetical protein